MYKLSKKIGEGGYGKVYVATCMEKKMKQPEKVAIKIMHHDSLDAKVETKGRKRCSFFFFFFFFFFFLFLFRSGSPNKSA